MSQSSTAPLDPAIDPFLSPMSTLAFGEDDLADFFTSRTDDSLGPVGNAAYDAADFTLDDALLVPTNSPIATPSLTPGSTPDTASYPFDQQDSLSYLYSNSKSPQSYPPHPLHHRSETHDSLLPPPSPFSPTNPPPHRRSLSYSLSHSDAATLSCAPQPPNPIFYRLQATRAKPATPDDGPPRHRRRRGPYTEPTAKRCRTGTHTSALLLHTPIGIPLSCASPPHDPAGAPVQLTGPSYWCLAYMGHGEQMARSRRVIEIGAMAVLNGPRGEALHGQASRNAPAEGMPADAQSVGNGGDEGNAGKGSGYATKALYRC